MVIRMCGSASAAFCRAHDTRQPVLNGCLSVYVLPHRDIGANMLSAVPSNLFDNLPSVQIL